ncbi:hypothetical protein ACHAWO_001966 [Cyclotella atomus]|uniref:Endoplasmic reticulum-Golgi intermediate compartment protein 3 n=1 Tax=Cyclotella atomus TaxID=382360 RepID=A0ABD3MLU5_9STRA
MSKSSSNYTDYIRSLDAHSPISPEFRIRTLAGATLSIFTLLLATTLIITEYNYNFSTSFLNHVHVMPQTPDGLEVEFDISFPHIPCALLAVDSNDPTGQSQSFHINKSHRVWKHRLDANGNTIGRKSRFELGGSIISSNELKSKMEELAQKRMEQFKEQEEEVDDEEECGSCYGAGEEGECCNTCDDVKRAYRRKSWHIQNLSEISQCKHLLRAEAEENEGCNIHGFVALGTGGGNLHFAPDRQWEKEGSTDANKNGLLLGGGFVGFESILEMFNEQFEQFNVTHTVNKIVFGPYLNPTTRRVLNLTSQLDGATRTVSDGYGMFQYYLQVVPTVFRFRNGTTIETFQYSVTEHTRHVDPGSNRGLPGVFFFYEVSALHVEFEEYCRGWTHFFTGVCAAVGGAFTVMGMLDRLLFDWKSGRGSGSSLGR